MEKPAPNAAQTLSCCCAASHPKVEAAFSPDHCKMLKGGIHPTTTPPPHHHPHPSTICWWMEQALAGA